MKHRIVEVKVAFKGLYEWGIGWDESTQTKWKAFLNVLNDSMWDYVKVGEGILESDHLISTSANVFLHPMDFHTYIPCIGSSYRYVDGERVETFPYAEHLIDIAKKLAEYCGGSIVVERFMLHKFDDEGHCETTKLHPCLQEC